MEDWFHSILQYLFKNQRLDDTNIDITNFLLTELKIPNTDVRKSAQLRNVFNYLKSKGFIDWAYTSTTDGAIAFGAPHTLENHENIETSTLKHHEIFMKLTLDGYNYFTERERLKQQHDSIIKTNDSVRGTNKKTWIIAGVAALFAILTFFKSFQQDHQLQNIKLQLQEQLQDSSQQIRETFKLDIQRLKDSQKTISNYNITDILRDTIH